MAGTPATTALRRAGIAHTLHEYELQDGSGRASGQASGHASGRSGGRGRGRDGRHGYGLDAAAALGVDPGRIFKTLIVSVDGRLGAGIVPVDAELDLKAIAAALGGRTATMADPADAERATGYVVGGISPIGLRRRLPAVLDASALDHPTIYVSAGRRGLQVELDPRDLVHLVEAKVDHLRRR
jgi:Cys-tRNA(Pro)/Cys-tRNA(Cys) deacylase